MINNIIISLNDIIMSISNLFSGNDLNIYCNEMHCKNMVPPSGIGTQGDIYNVDALGVPRFGKLVEGVGPTQPMQIKNMPFEILSDNGLAPAILGVGADAAHGMPAIIGMGNLATQDSFFFAYDDNIKTLALGQNNACVDHDFRTELNNGHLVVNNKLQLPTVTANNLLKIDGSNVVVAATSTDVPNIYSADGSITDATRTINGNGADLNLNNISIFTNNSSRSLINASSRVEINTPTLILNQLIDGLLQVDGSGNVSTIANSNLGFVTHTSPGSYNITVPANATLAKLTGVGGGGGSCLHIGFASPGGGAAGSVFDYPISVLAGQTIAVTVGSGGAPNADGTDTVFSIGSQTITCGKGLTSTDQLHGGNGGSVNLGFTTISGGAGGNFQAVGANGNSSYFVCSGAGGGGTRANGGNALLFTGGSADANYGGGGASGFANGANNHANGSKGSGGGADNGSGGDGFISISFYS